ncbi:hypothetical protein [Paenibacillus campi]|uniref:hypothetical protein n=1 Tax=Paenibacillus campi TaxID=3106031 RepID=UPI002AFE4874|nr:hypothetical protein [Paenibacillus sp. SGZ-1009]
MELSPAILSAIISAAIAIITLIISTSITLRKNNHEERSYFEKNLKEKLEHIYLPLNLEISLRKSDERLIQQANQELIYKYGYLLNPKLLYDLRELIHFETNEADFLVKEEYLALREHVMNEFKKEFTLLQSLYNSHFESYRQKYTMTHRLKLKNGILKVCIAITILFYSMVVIKIIYDSINNDPKVFENPILTFIITFILIIPLFTTALGIGAVGIKCTEWFEIRAGKKRNAYKYNDKVPLTGEYQCTACGKKHIKIQYTTFGYCNDHTWTQVWKSVFNFGLWRKLQ